MSADWLDPRRGFGGWSLEGRSLDALEEIQRGQASQTELLSGLQRQGPAQTADLLTETNQSIQAVGTEMANGLLEVSDQLNTLGFGIAYGLREVTNKIQDVGLALGNNLIAVRWQLERLNSSADQLLELTRNRLKNEARQHYETAVKCFQVGEAELAEEWFDKTLTFDPTLYLAYQHLGIISLHCQTLDDAIAQFTKAVNFATNDQLKGLSSLYLAKSLFEKRDFARALSNAENALHLNPNTSAKHDCAAYAAFSGNQTAADKYFVLLLLDDPVVAELLLTKLVEEGSAEGCAASVLPKVNKPAQLETLRESAKLIEAKYLRIYSLSSWTDMLLSIMRTSSSSIFEAVNVLKESSALLESRNQNTSSVERVSDKLTQERELDIASKHVQLKKYLSEVEVLKRKVAVPDVSRDLEVERRILQSSLDEEKSRTEILIMRKASLALTKQFFGFLSILAFGVMIYFFSLAGVAEHRVSGGYLTCALLSFPFGLALMVKWRDKKQIREIDEEVKRNVELITQRAQILEEEYSDSQVLGFLVGPGFMPRSIPLVLQERWQAWARTRSWQVEAKRKMGSLETEIEDLRRSLKIDQELKQDIVEGRMRVLAFLTSLNACMLPSAFMSETAAGG